MQSYKQPWKSDFEHFLHHLDLIGALELQNCYRIFKNTTRKLLESENLKFLESTEGNVSGSIKCLLAEPPSFLLPGCIVGMDETSCDRKEVLQELVGDTSNYVVNEGPFGRIRAKNKNTICE